MEWWKSNSHRFHAWEEVKDDVREYYGDHYKPDRAFNEISDLKQTDTVQKYLNDIDRLNVYTKMTDHHLINISLNGITPRLHQTIAHYEDLYSDPPKWKEKLLHMDLITTEFQKKQQDDRSKGQEKKRDLDERIQLKGRDAGSEKKKGKFVPKEVWDKQNEEGRCMKCGRSNHQEQDCKALSRAKTTSIFGNANQEPVQKKRKFDPGHLKITELGSEEDSGNE